MSQILTPQFGNRHDVAYALEEQLRKSIRGVIEELRDRNEYWILVASFPDPSTGFIRTKIMTWPIQRKPKPMLGTILYYRDNRTDTLTRMWVLPRDMPIPEDLCSDTVDNPAGALCVWNVEDDVKRLGIENAIISA